MDKIVEIKKLIQSLQIKIKSGSLDGKAIISATKTLEYIGYKYDSNLFPELPANNEYCADVGNAPTSLAEALLWKMGKWNVYRDFVRNYNSEGPLVKKSDVVFAAFARHLKDNSKPIYDQHALRAMWAINTGLTNAQQYQCKSALIKSKGKDKGKWKATLSGSETIVCYELYIEQLDSLTCKDVTKSAFDKLLMPLGQALKANSANYDEFMQFCAFNKN